MSNGYERESFQQSLSIIVIIMKLRVSQACQGGGVLLGDVVRQPGNFIPN